MGVAGSQYGCPQDVHFTKITRHFFSFCVLPSLCVQDTAMLQIAEFTGAQQSFLFPQFVEILVRISLKRYGPVAEVIETFFSYASS